MRIIGFSIGFLALVACNDTMKDVYENENLPLQIAGKVTDIIAYKGGGISIVVKTTTIREQEIAISGGVKHTIREGDFFRKLKNSNQCEIVRHDSLYRCDCYTIPEDIKQALEPVAEWPASVKGKWVEK